jgi:hypothetical protein
MIHQLFLEIDVLNRIMELNVSLLNCHWIYVMNEMIGDEVVEDMIKKNPADEDISHCVR